MREVKLEDGRIVKTGFMDMKEVMAYLGVGRTSVIRWMKDTTHPIPYYQPKPRCIRFDVKEVDAWIKGAKEAA